MAERELDRRAEASRFSHGTHALIVGISDYGLAGMPQLPAFETEAQRLAETLSDATGCAVPKEQITTLIGEDATRDAILGELGKIAVRAGSTDSIFVCFAGHGLALDGAFVLCTNETGGLAGVHAS